MVHDEAVVADVENEMTLLSRHHQHGLKGLTLDRSAYLLLGRLECEHPLSTKELAAAFGLDVSTVSRQITALLREGLVEYVLDPNGGTARKVRASATGQSRLRADRRYSHDGISRVVATWSPADLALFRELLTRFNVDLERLQGNRWPGPRRRASR